MIRQGFMRKALLGFALSATALCSVPANAVALKRVKSYEGNINFAGTQVSVRDKTGGKGVCNNYSSGSATLRLPKDATIVAARLYWAGSGGTIDREVKLGNTSVTALPEHRYVASKGAYTYFAAAADVTDLLPKPATESMTLTFSDLTVSTTEPYCAKKQDNVIVAGFSLVVVYVHANEPYRAVNVYEGLEAMQSQSVTVPMQDAVPDTGASALGRFGYIVWEGDRPGNMKGESAVYAGEDLTDPSFANDRNIYNAKSSANRDENSYGIDFDIFDLANVPTKEASSAVFSTGGDMVVLSTAIMAVPSKPTSDLSIAKTQGGALRVGQTVDYTLNVTNNGQGPASNFVVEDELPSQLKFVSASGSGWTCNAVGQKVTCTHVGQLHNGGSAPVVIKAEVLTAGEVTNTASVRGTNDPKPDNNTSTVKGTSSAPVVAGGPYVFTVGECKPGETVKSAPAQGLGTGCTRFAGPVTAGATTQLWVTKAVNNVAQSLGSDGATSVSFAFSLECNNPKTAAAASPQRATVSGQTLPVCGADGSQAENIAASTPQSFNVTAATASVKVEFAYRDVGEVTLRVKTGSQIGGAVDFISKPAKLKYVSIKRANDGVANPGSITLAQPGFAEVGEPFVVEVRALGTDGATTLPNFGNELALDGTRLVDSALVLRTGTATGATSLKPEATWQGSGVVSRAFQWNELGTVDLMPVITYLDGMEISADESRVVGRFYPAYFTTENSGGFACLKRMMCPTGGQQAIEQAIYSEQTFRVKLRVFGRNGELTNLDTAWLQTITLAGMKAAGAPANDVALTGFTSPPDSVMLRSASFRLATGFDANMARPAPPLSWTAPTPLYVRATAPETRAGVGAVTISSLREKPEDSVEDGIMVINGRLMVGNVIGSPQLKTPIPMRAQFWSGSNWENNTAYDDDEIIQAANVQFTSCRRSLRLNATITTPDNCNTELLQPVANLSLAMTGAGQTTYILQPLKAGINGSADVWVRTERWLPSTYGRVTFDQYTSPVIYVREMY